MAIVEFLILYIYMVINRVTYVANMKGNDAIA